MSAVGSDVLDRRVAMLEKKFAPTGDLEVEDVGARRRRRRVRFTIIAPGFGLPTEATFVYSERYARRAEGWLLVAYAYEYLPAPRPSRRAHHLHGPWGTHQHCVDPRRPRAPHHFRDYRQVMEQAHEEFTRLHALHRPIRCRDLVPIRAVRRAAAESVI